MKQPYDIMSIRMCTLGSLKGKIKQAKERIAFLEKRINDAGIDGRYSINEDLLEIAKSIWMQCNKLALLKQINKINK